MAEILGLGVTHSPLLVCTDERVAGIFGRVLRGL
jgi:hypothetical protein